MTDIGFIGLGVMGAPMAGHLLTAGHRLHISTRTRNAATDDLVQRGAQWLTSPAAVAQASEVVFTIVGMPHDVEAVYFSDNGLLRGMQPGSVLVDMTTSSPELASRIAAAARERGGSALDAPVSGGDSGARAGSLSIMVGGDSASFERILPLLRLLGHNIVHQGPAGAGQHCKLCNQITIAGTMLGVCEAMAYARASGLDPERALASIGSGAAGSWALSNLAPKMLRHDYAPGFVVRHFIKDMGLATEAAEAHQLTLPALQLALQRYRELADEGREFDGTQALFRLYNPD
ncbi:MAG: NAD(P)-dependent oxidoreductase [Planctomycetota bacterium]